MTKKQTKPPKYELWLATKRILLPALLAAGFVLKSQLADHSIDWYALASAALGGGLGGFGIDLHAFATTPVEPSPPGNV